MGAGNPARLLAGDLRALAAAARAAFGWETAAIGILLVFAALWLATAIAVYPPRGIDDLVYHLPPVYQAVQDHAFRVLPLELRKFFAFPFSGEMSFLWVTLLTGSARWVDGSQAGFALLAIAAVYVLGRRFGLSPRGAALAGGLFGLMPVVLLQATSNYVDIVANAWLLAAAVALLRYEEGGAAAGGSRLSLALAGLATGLFPRQQVPVADSRRGARRDRRDPHQAPRELARARLTSGALFALPALLAGGYWYARNLLAYGNPFYPLPVRLFGTTIFQGDWPQGPSILSRVATDPAELLRITLWDPGVGTFNGGFGFLFCGFAVPALLWAAASLAREAGRALPPRLLVLGLVPAAFFTLFLTPYDDLQLTPRYVLATGGFAFIAFALLIEAAARRGGAPAALRGDGGTVFRGGAGTALRALAVLAAALCLLPPAESNRPLLNLAPAAAEGPGLRALSEQRYIRYAGWDLAPMSQAWAPLDEMTRDGAGLEVYQAADWKVFWTAPTFGTGLQNRVWNFERGPAREPEAFFFHVPRQSPLYMGREIRRETVAADPRFRLAAADGDDATTLYVSREALSGKGREARLVEFYRATRAEFVEATRASAAQVEPDAIVLAPFPLAAGWLVHKADGRLRGAIEPMTSKEIAAAPSRWPGRVLYTPGGPIPGLPSRKVAELVVRDSRIPLYRNEPAEGRR